MTTRDHIFRLAAVCCCVGVTTTAAQLSYAQLLTTPKVHEAADANDATSGPLSDNYEWDSHGLAIAEPTNGSAAGPTIPQPSPAVRGSGDTPSNAPGIEDASSLAKRIEVLENTIRQMKTAETLPPPAKKETKEKASDAKDGECIPKLIDPITKPTFQPLGRITFDGVAYDDDDDSMAFFHTDRADELGFRSIRIGGKGNIYENLIYNFEVELRGTNSAISFKDIYMEQQELPYVGHLRAGHFKEPIGMEEFGSDLYLTFMERSIADQAFAPARNFGAMFWDTTDDCQDVTWFTGIFRADSPDSPTNTGLWRSNNDDWCFDARAAWLPYYDEPSNGRYLVHLGGSYTHRHIGGLTPGATFNQNVAYSTLNGLAEFSTRSWVGSQGPIGFGTEANSNEWNQIDPELLVIWGSASLQAEYFQLFMNSGEQFNGGYAFLSYFLTGENRAYRKDLKVIDRTQPFEPFFWVDTAKGQCCGWGAWELAAGYSWVNLNDGHDTVATNPANANNRRRGFDNAFVIGLNWYQNPWSQMKFDFTHEMVDFVDGGVPSDNANIFGVRWQVDW